jgi:hypothetical protein
MLEIPEDPFSGETLPVAAKAAPDLPAPAPVHGAFAPYLAVEPRDGVFRVVYPLVEVVKLFDPRHPDLRVKLQVVS